MRAGTVCDFCADDVADTDPNAAEFEHEAFTFTSHAELGTVTILHPAGGWWLACTFCKPLVRNREWRKVLDRYCDHCRRVGRPLDPSMRGEATTLQRKLGQHLTGRERQPHQAAAGAA